MKLRFNKDTFLSLIFHPAFLALPFFLFVLLFGEISFSPYKIILQEVESIDVSDEKHVYYDIDSDSINEKVRGYNLLTNATVIAYTLNESIYEAWNLTGKWIDNKVEFILHDLDQDGTAELYALTVSNLDSLWINQLVMKRRENIQQAKAVCKLRRFNDNFDQDLGILGFTDINGDKIDDIIFYVSSGFTLQPRAFFAWDIHNDKIIKSKYSGINYKSNQQFIHIPDGENALLNIFTENSSTDNYRKPVPYSDTASYAVVFTENLNYLFEPVLLGGAQSNTATYPFYHDGKLVIMAIAENVRKEKNRVSFHLINRNGRVLTSLDTSLFDHRFSRMKFNDQVLVMHDNPETSELGVINHDMQYVKKFCFGEYYYPAKMLNLDNDEKDELILLNRTKNRIGIMQEDLKTFVTASVPQIENSPFNPSLKSINKEGSEVFLQTADYLMNFIYFKNKLYPFRFFIYVLIFLMIFAFLFLLQRIFIFTNNRRRNREQKLMNYQLQSVMNQLNPHFTFNAINSIGYAIMQGKKEEAYDYFTKLSGLIRKSMKNAFLPYKTLGEEVSFVKEYLEIEEYRFNEKLSWEMKIDPEVDLSFPVPKMLIHIFVENAVKHGIFHLKEKGKIDINIMGLKPGTKIVVEDNGIGFKEIINSKNSDGKGFKIMDNYLNIYNSTMKRRITYRIENSDGVKGGGTKVIIWIM